MKSVAVIIPVYNEESNLRVLCERLDKVLAGIPETKFTILFVDDHSADRTPSLLADLAAKDPRVKWLRLSRNSGSHVACAAGLDQCEADAAVIMAADLQDPPELIPRLLEKHAQGSQLVWAARERREGETWFTLAASRCFYWLLERFTEIKLPPRGADVLLADRCVVNAFRQMPERNISLFVAFSSLGFRQSAISYVKEARHAGASKWTLRRKIQMAVDSFVGFSYVPLRFMSYAGMLAAGFGAGWAVFILLMKLRGAIQETGYASTMIAILILGGLQMVMLGVLGEYLWRTLEEARRRPRYFVESSSLRERQHPPSGLTGGVGPKAEG